MDNLISIIIPTYNRHESLRKAIESITKQSGTNWEIIIVDDGSNDNTREKIMDFILCDRIRYHYQINAGVSAARNKGAELSKGNYLIFLDSDDYFFPGLIEELNNINFNKFDLICWQVLKKVDGKTSVWKPYDLGKMYNNITASFLAGSVCYRKEVFIEAGGFDTMMTFGENYELGLRISSKHNLRIKIIDREFLFYRISQKTRESNSLFNRITSYEHLYKKHFEKYKKHKKSHSNIQYLLGYVYQQHGNLSNAQKYYSSSFKNFPFNYKALLRLIYFKLFRR